jgi:hypothetical protein
MMRQQLLWQCLSVGAVAVCVSVACASAPDPDAQVTAGQIDKAGFRPVALMLGRRCGSIDCHGSRFRNLRLYGFGGVRKLPTDTPEAPATSPQEIDDNYDAFMTLEPGAMYDFIQGGRTAPQTLTVFRKARGDENHKGGRRIVAGDPADLCLSSWLTATVDVASCTLAASETNPLLDAP